LSLIVKEIPCPLIHKQMSAKFFVVSSDSCVCVCVRAHMRVLSDVEWAGSLESTELTVHKHLGICLLVGRRKDRVTERERQLCFRYLIIKYFACD
jgi:hypothetical protein